MAKEQFQRTKPHVNIGVISAIGTKTLKLNASGPEVKKLQAFLIKEMKVKLDVSGRFDAATEDAVRRWQKKNELKADGVFDPKAIIGGAKMELVKGGKAEPTGDAGKNDMRHFKSTMGHLLNARKQLRALQAHLDRAEKLFKQAAADGGRMPIKPAEFHKQQQLLAHELAHVLQQYNAASAEFIKSWRD